MTFDMPRIDKSINVSTLLAVGAVLVSMISYFTSTANRLTTLEAKVDSYTELLIDVATQAVEIRELQKKVEQLRVGP